MKNQLIIGWVVPYAQNPPVIRLLYGSFYSPCRLKKKKNVFTSVGDPDPHVFGPGFGSISQRSGSGSFTFLKKVFSELK
jgi:hypothetical protein